MKPVCLDLMVLEVFQETTVLMVPMVLMVLPVMMVLPELMVFPELMEQREKWDPREREVLLVGMDLMDPRESRELPDRRVLPGSRAKRETRDLAERRETKETMENVTSMTIPPVTVIPMLLLDIPSPTAHPTVPLSLHLSGPDTLWCSSKVTATGSLKISVMLALVWRTSSSYLSCSVLRPMSADMESGRTRASGWVPTKRPTSLANQ